MSENGRSTLKRNSMQLTSSTRQFEFELCWSSSKIISGFFTIKSSTVSISVSVLDVVVVAVVVAKNGKFF